MLMKLTTGTQSLVIDMIWIKDYKNLQSVSQI